MNPIVRLAVMVSALMPCHELAAQTFKCTDAAGRVHYTSTKCSDLGLKDGGEIQNRLQVTPAPANQPSPRSEARPSTTGRDEQAAKKPAAAEDEAKNPQRRCFTTNVGGKSVTRCNDRPDESAD